MNTQSTPHVRIQKATEALFLAVKRVLGMIHRGKYKKVAVSTR